VVLRPEIRGSGRGLPRAGTPISGAVLRASNRSENLYGIVACGAVRPREGDHRGGVRAEKGIRRALVVDAAGDRRPRCGALGLHAHDAVGEGGVGRLDLAREGEVLRGVFVADPEAGVVGEGGEARERLRELCGRTLEEPPAAGEKERVTREGVPSADEGDRAEGVTGDFEHVKRGMSVREHIPVRDAARLPGDAARPEVVVAPDDVEAGMGGAQVRDTARVIEVVMRAPDSRESQPARRERCEDGRAFRRIDDDGFSARRIDEQIGIVVVQQGNRDDVDRRIRSVHAATIRALPRTANRDIVARVSSSSDDGFQKRKRALVVLTVVATPLALGMETLVRTQVFPLLMGGDFEEVRAVLGPLLTPVAWGLCGVAILANIAGFALYARLVARSIARLPPERRALGPERERAALGAFLLAASVPQVPCILSTLTFTFGAPLAPVLVGVTLGSLGVFAQALRTRSPA